MITAKEMRSPRRKKCWRPDLDTDTTLVFFPHLRAGAVRRLLSSETKRGTYEKVPRRRGMKVPRHKNFYQFRQVRARLTSGNSIHSVEPKPASAPGGTNTPRSN